MYEQRLKKMFKNQKEFSPKLGAPGLEQTKSRRPKTNRKHKKKKVSPKLQEMLENKEEVFSRKKGPGEAKEVNSKVAEFHSDDTSAGFEDYVDFTMEVISLISFVDTCYTWTRTEWDLNDENEFKEIFTPKPEETFQGPRWMLK